MNNCIINIIPFDFLKESITIRFSPHQDTNGKKIHRNSLSEEDLDMHSFDSEGYTYYNFEPIKDSSDYYTKTKSILLNSDHLYKEKFLIKDLLNRLIYAHFCRNGLITSNNFIKDTEVWIRDKTLQEITIYKRFTIRIELTSISHGLGILITYDGKSCTYNKSLDTILPKTKLKASTKVIHKNSLTNIENLNSADYKNAYIKLTRYLEKELNITSRMNDKVLNKYIVYYDEIQSFYKKYLSGQIIGNLIHIYNSGFLKVYNSIRTRPDSNTLLFKDGHKNVNVYDGLKAARGPYQLSPFKNIKFIFIFENKYKDEANRLYTYFNKGYKNYPGIEQFIGVPFELDIQNTIRLDPIDDIVNTVKDRIKSLHTNHNSYFAIYISSISKNEEVENKHNIYFRLKEVLLQKNISSQVIYKENLHQSSFNFYLPNISVAILAKLQGKPWRLPNPINNDLVIGFGIYRNEKKSEDFIGNAVCFKTDGTFEEFDVFQGNNLQKIGNELKSFVNSYLWNHKNCNRLILHYYKDINNREATVLDNIIANLQTPIPYIILNINDTIAKDYVVFDKNYVGLMPVSGTIIPIKYNQYLLFNNTRYSEKSAQKIQDYPFPIKIKIYSKNYDQISNRETMKELIEQVYQFSRIYWKSIKQQNKPVTIEYSEIIAQLVSHFESKKLPDTSVAKKTLWFL